MTSLRCLLLIAMIAARLAAAVGPENVAVVVNDDSWASRVVAEAYLAARPIPDRNVIHLDGLGCDEYITSVDFRERILRPAMAALVVRGIDEHVDVIAFSSDLPSFVHFGDERPEAWPGFEAGHGYWQYGHAASATGLTMLADLALAGDAAGYTAAGSNRGYVPARDPEGVRPVEPDAEQAARYRAAMQRFAAGEHADAAAELVALAEAGMVHPTVASNEACAWAPRRRDRSRRGGADPRRRRGLRRRPPPTARRGPRRPARATARRRTGRAHPESRLPQRAEPGFFPGYPRGWTFAALPGDPARRHQRPRPRPRRGTPTVRAQRRRRRCRPSSR